MRALRPLLVALATLGLFAGFLPSAQADTGTDTYVVQLKKTVSASSVAPSLGANAKVLNRVHAAIAQLTATQAAALKNNPNVISVRKNSKIKASGQETPAPWDLDLLDNRTGTIDHAYNYPNTGTGVTVYVIDSGLIPTHTEFASATILPGINYVQVSDPTTECGKNLPEDTTVNPADTLDQAGHGTAVSSLVVGAMDGVAKDATIVPIRVLDCDGGGRTSDVISAVDWIITQHASLGGPAVVNMSFGARASDADLDLATQALLDAGITVVAAAGNENADACLTSPGRVLGAITAAAVTSALAEPVWPDGQGHTYSTNYGTCVDLYAPGARVIVADWRTAAGGAYADGTSFSAPLIAGAAAQVLADHPTWSPAQVSADLSDRATYGVINGARSVNKLVNVNGLGTITGTAPTISSPTRVGDVVSAQLHWTPVPNQPTYEWSLDGVPIPQATAATYVPKADDLGKSLTVAVTGSYPGYTDISDTSAAVFVAEAPPPPPAGMVTPLQPSRLMDTRVGVGANGPLTNGRTVALHVAGVGGVSPTATAVLVNITCTGATAGGFITGHASGTGMPGVSNANFIAGKTGANLALIPVGSDGSIWLTAAVNGGTVQLVVDLQGFVSGGGAVTEPGAVVPVSPQRLADTRYSGAVGGGGTLYVAVTNAAGVAPDAAAVFLNVTVTSPGTPGFLTAYPYGESRPTTSNLNFVPGQTVPNMVLVKVAASGIVAIFNGSATAVHIVVDIQGYVIAGRPTATGAVKPISPTRVLDTRYGLGSTPGAVNSGSERVITFTGEMAGAAGVFMNLTVTNTTGSGYLSAYPANQGRPPVSNLNFDAGATVPNLAAVALNNSQCTLFAAVANGGSVQMVADVFAYIL